MRAAPFEDREQAGRLLGERLQDLGLAGPLVLGLARGGVEVARPVADALGGELDVVVVRKVARPSQPELGLGAVAEEGPVLWDRAGLRHARLAPDDLEAVVAAEREECRRRVLAYRDGREPLPVTGREVVVVDDGVATGVSALAALRSVRTDRPSRVVMAAPVAAAPTVPLLTTAADDVVVLQAPEQLGAVSRYYVHFEQTPDDVVVSLLSAYDR